MTDSSSVPKATIGAMGNIAAMIAAHCRDTTIIPAVT